MNKIGLFYSTISQMTKSIAMLIKTEMGADVDLFNIAYAHPEKMLEYNHLILGAPTWDEEGIEDDMIGFLSRLPAKALQGKKVALFGLGDQRLYPQAFINSLGTIYRKVKELGGEVVGRWPTLGYRFSQSTAVDNYRFVGLALDEENETQKTIPRVEIWAQLVKNEFAKDLAYPA